ncbi:MAG: hypothetical protein NT084_13850 [Bacteroidetes bacterium]|jgi:hypothetical protein|nr:hypothetical protein [Bacteroidota bacterium]
MSEIRHYDLQLLEDDYRELTARGNLDAAERMKVLIATVRYELRMDAEVIFEYRHGLDEPMVMRILKNEKDLDRWVESRFIRLSEFFEK